MNDSGSESAATDEGSDTVEDGGSTMGTSPDATTADDTATADGSDGGPGDPGPAPQLPDASGPCPEIVNGEWTTLPIPGGTYRVLFSFADDDRPFDERPLAISFNTGTPGNLPGDIRGDFQPEGGIIARPELLTQWWGPEHLDVIDAIVACTVERMNADPYRIHAVGLSKGGSMVRILASERTRYMASVAVFSSGTQSGVGEPLENDDNRFPLLVAYGSEADDQPFRDLTIEYRDELSAAGHPVIECPHETGHRYPYEMGPATARFFLDHPFGTAAVPYDDGMPGDYPAYCSIYP